MQHTSIENVFNRMVIRRMCNEVVVLSNIAFAFILFFGVNLFRS
jgi:hypothetical protein